MPRNTRNSWFFILIMICLMLTNFAHAVEINKRTRLDPGSQTKVNQALSKSYVAGLGLNTPQSLTNAGQGGCGNTEIGTLTNARSNRIENITVVRGDVITVGRGKCQ